MMLEDVHTSMGNNYNDVVHFLIFKKIKFFDKLKTSFTKNF